MKDPLGILPPAARVRLCERAQPVWVPPMLATLTSERFSRAGWWFEPKLDGERCLAFARGGVLRLLSRNRQRLNDKYPEIVQALRLQPLGSFIADGEIVAFENGVTSFARLQRRMQVEHPPAELLREVPVCLYLFDLLYLDGHDIRQVPLRHRKALLRRAVTFRDGLRFTEHRATEGVAYYRQACRKGWEGVVAKNAASAYVSRRTRDWLKFKCRKAQELVVVGYTDPRGSRVGFGALLVGYYDRERLVYAGKVGTGYDTATLERLRGRLERLEPARCPFAGNGLPRRGVHWVKPRLVAQIGFSEWTPGGKLRHPRFLGLRDDKRPKQVVREG